MCRCGGGMQGLLCGCGVPRVLPILHGVVSAAGLRLVAVQDGELRQRGAGAEEWEEALR